MAMIGTCVVPSRWRATASSTASIHVGSSHATTSPAAIPAAARPAAMASDRSRSSANVTRRPARSTSASASGVASARASTALHRSGVSTAAAVMV